MFVRAFENGAQWRVCVIRESRTDSIVRTDLRAIARVHVSTRKKTCAHTHARTSTLNSTDRKLSACNVLVCLISRLVGKAVCGSMHALDH